MFFSLSIIRTYPKTSIFGLIGKRAGYDSDPLDKCLAEERGVELIAPHKSN
jgi:hypothetical protein